MELNAGLAFTIVGFICGTLVFLYFLQVLVIVSEHHVSPIVQNLCIGENVAQNVMPNKV